MWYRRLCPVILSVLLATVCGAADGVWTADDGVWTNTAAWSDNLLPGIGDTASFTGSGGTVTVPAGYPFTLSALFFNTNGVYGTWTLSGETNTLGAPATVRVDGTTYTGVTTINSVLEGTAGLTKTGTGILELAAATNLFSGNVTVVGGGMLRAHADQSLGVVPVNPVADALVLDGGVLVNMLDPLNISVNRGITLGASNGWFLARYFATTVISSKITGTGSVFIARHNGTVVFSNPDNDYSGDTTVGSVCVGSPTDGIAAAPLQLGADEVIPDGPGKGRLVIDGKRDGQLDLNDKTETVNSLWANYNALLTNSAGTAGVLVAGVDNGDVVFNGNIAAGATLNKAGTGVLHFAESGQTSGGLIVSEGSLDFSRASALGNVTVTLDGGSLNMQATQPGLVESVAKIPDAYLHPWISMTETSVRLGTHMGNTPIIAYPNYTQYGYRGQLHVPSAGLYSFAKNFDNGGYLVVDGVTVISNSVLQDVVVVQNVSLSEGWHTLDVFFSQGTSSVGPNVPGFTSGIMFDPANGPFTNATEIAAAARRFEDPGDGSLLRTFDLTGTNVVNARLELAQDGTFDRSATAASLVWAADVVAAANATGTPILTVSGGTEPFRMGATSRSAVFGTDISDPNGVVFQDRVWLLNTPDSSTWSILPGAEIAYGTPGVLTTGTLILTNFSARLPASDALGTGGETVTVAGVNNGVWFDATRESDGMLFDDPAYSFTASNNVVFTGTGAVAGFDGAGSVTYNGSISGSGTLVKNGTGDVVLSAASTFSGDVQVNAGRLLAGDDAQLGDSGNSVTVAGGMLGNASSVALTLDRDILVTSGGFDVQDASLNLSGVVSGTAEKQGAGTLVLEGASANTGLDLTVSQGDAVLNKSGVPAVENLTVSTGARAQLAGSGDNQIAGTVTLTGGILDLNGVDETINGLNSTDLSSTVTNGGASSAVLTVGGEDADGTFFGSWADGSSLGLTKTGNGVFSMVGAIGSQTATGDLRVESGTVSLGIGLRYVRITPLETAGMWPAIGEFQLLRDGVPLAWPAGTTAAATSYTSSYPPENLIDSNSRSVWRAGAVAASIVIDFQGPLLFNGYRWYTGDVNQSDPVSWTVEVSADNTVWFMADTRTDQTIVANRSVLAGTYAFNGMWPGDAVSVNASAIVASNARLRAALPYESVAGLTGAGEVSLAGGARLRVADADTFTGSVSGDGQLLLGGHAALDVALLSDEVTVANDAAGPVVVTVGAKGESLFTGALTDGTAPLGLVKQGNDTLMLVDAGSTYTGDTKIEAGTLSVQSPVWNFRYVRFNPTQTVGGGVDSYGVPFSISEFQLMRNGQTVAYPAGKTVSTPYAAYNSSYTAAGAVNGLTGPTTTDRWLSTALPNPLTIDMKSGVQFDAYRWYTCSSVNDNHRAPNAWTVEGSNDGITWVQLDNQSDVAITPWVSGSGVEVGPFSLRSARYNLPGEYWAETNSMALKLAAVSARYLRFTPTAARVEDSTDSFGSSGFQLAELQLMRDGVPLNYPAGTTASAPGGSWLGYMFLPQRAVDNDISTTSANRWYSDAMVNPLTVDMTQQVAFDAYRWFTAYNTPTRDPISWTLEVSNNMTDWYTVDVQTNQSVPETRSAAAGLWALDIPAGQLATDAIPDDSRTIVMTSATLRIDAGSETIGPLSGTGTVFMAASGVLGLNGFEAADYAGDITGAGTVEKSGTETQTLSGTLSFSGAIIVDEGVLDLTGATLTGVTNIVIRSGGTLTGKATVNGDLTVTFEGGLYRADLAVSGALSVVGDMLLSMPNGVELPYAHRLFSFGSADTATRAAIQASQSSLTVPTGFMPAVRVTADAAYLTVSAPGTLLIIN